jgi:hypothetical protein
VGNRQEIVLQRDTTRGTQLEMVYDIERLAAYQKIVAVPYEPSEAHRYGYKVTAPVKTSTPQLARKAAQFIEYLQRRQLKKQDKR